MNEEKTNTKAAPADSSFLGGKISLGTCSAAMKEEAEAFKQYKEDLLLIGPVSEESKAKEYRVAMLKYYDRIAPKAAGKLRKLFQGINLTY